MRRGAACAVLLAATAPAAGAQQSLFERLNLDRLQLTALGVASGPLYPSRAEPTRAYSVHADYGELAANWRVVFTVTYWESEFRREVVDRFAQRILEATVDPARDDTLRIGRVTLSDIALETDVRRIWLPQAFMRPYAGGGVGMHIINAENRFIEGTFVESALDNIAAGLTAVAGVETHPRHRLTLGAQARVTLLSNTRFASVRATGSYHFTLAPPPRSP